MHVMPHAINMVWHAITHR